MRLFCTIGRGLIELSTLGNGAAEHRHNLQSKGPTMMAFSLILAAGAITAIVASVFTIVSDGYGRVADRKLVRIY